MHIRSDALEVSVLAYGASLVGLRFAGQPHNMVIGFKDPADHARVPVCAGAIVGPIANRIRAGRVTLGGTAYQMPLNEAGRTSLHSGPHGLHTRDWQVETHRPDQLTLTCALPDGACGLPGNRVFTATYALEGATLTLGLRATTDRPTPINLASHPYWNLDGAADISRHLLQVNAQQYLPTDADNLPLGKQAPVENTAFDFTSPRAVPLSPALDVNYCLATASAPQPAATLQGSNGTILQIDTTAPGLQVYNGAHLPKAAALWQDGPAMAAYAGIALEPQHWPDAPHHPDFPQITVMPNGTYRQTTRFSLNSN